MSSKTRKTATEPTVEPTVEPTGHDYVAVVSLTNAEGGLLAAPGDRCDQVPIESLGWLAQRGRIVLADAPPAVSEATNESEATS